MVPLPGRQVWPQALPLVENPNHEFQGVGCVLADGSYLLSWKDCVDIVSNTRIMRYSSAHEELWTQPLSFQDMHINRLVPMNDGGFLIINNGTYMQARKFDAQGQALWNGQALNLGVSPPAFNMAVAEEASGGIWLLCTDESSYARYHYISPAGVPAVAGGTSIGQTFSASRPSIILSADGGAVLSFIQSYQNKIYRISSSLGILWQQSIAGQPYSYVNALLRTGTDSFYLVYGSNTLLARRYNYSGEQLWESDVEFSTVPISGISNWKVWQAPNGSVNAVWLAADGLHYGRISQDGTLLPELPVMPMTIEYETRFHDLHVLPGQSEPAFLSIIVSNYTSLKFLCCRLGATGFLDTQPIQMAVAPRLASFYPAPWYGVVGSELLCVYTHYSENQSEIKSVACDLEGNLNVNTIMTGSYGTFSEPVIAASGQQEFCAWLETNPLSSSSVSYKRVRYQLYNSNGTPLLPQPGILPGSGIYANISTLKVLALSDGQFMLFWKETGTTNRIRTQLISSSGSPLWEPEGRIVVERFFSNYALSQVAGDIYVAIEAGSTAILLQKISSGQPVWGLEGITLVTGSQTTGLLQIYALRGDYVVYGTSQAGSMYTGHTIIKVLRFSSAGSVLPGFGQDGISYNLVTGAERIYCGGALLTPQGLLIRVDHGFEIQEPWGPNLIIDQWQGFLVGFQGQNLWGDGILEFKYYLLGADNSGIYLRMVQQTQSVIRKLGYNGQQLWDAPCQITAYNNDYGDYGARVLGDGSWIGIGIVKTNDYSPTLKYYSFHSGGGHQLPSDTRLENRSHVINAGLAESGEALYVIWGLRNVYSTEYSHLFMQKLNSTPVSNDDPAVPGPAVLFMNSRPNPFVSSVTFSLESTRNAACELSIYNLRGQKVKQLMSSDLQQGSYSYHWDGRDETGASVAAGIYLVKLQVNGQKPLNRKVLKLKWGL